jgi:hypothetical protein
VTWPISVCVVAALWACGASVCGMGTSVDFLEWHSDLDSSVCSYTVLSR